MVWLFVLCALSFRLLAGTPDAHSIVETALAKDDHNSQLRRDYIYYQTETERELDSSNRVTTTTSKQHEVRYIFGAQYKKLVQKNGTPLPPKEQVSENQKLDKFASKQAKLSVQEKARSAKDQEDKRQKNRDFVKEVPNAFNFAIVGEDSIDGKAAWVIAADPKPGFKPSSFQAKMLPNLRGKFWIEKQGMQIMRIEAEVLDTISIGLFLARLSKGTRFQVELALINNELWAPKILRMDLDARLALLKHLHSSNEIVFSGYKKFSSESKIVATSEMK
jgi:hypothetical protein